MAGEVKTLGFLGAGQMATALARGWLSAGLIQREQLKAADPLATAREHFTQATGVAAFEKNLDILQSSSIVVLAVKPQSIRGLLTEMRPHVKPRHLIISIVAGIRLQLLADGLGGHGRLIRIMPNTPCLVGASASAYSVGPSATGEDMALVESFMTAVGKVFQLPENLLDAVTGLSGSGPAYVYTIIEALSDGGVKAGLPREVATVLAAQTVFGAARMVLETGVHPAELKDRVTSPGGTTIAGLHALEKVGLRAALIDAVEAATKRSTELGSS